MDFPLLGAVVNASAIIVCGLFGTLIGRGLPERFSDIVMKGLGLCVLIIGIGLNMLGVTRIKIMNYLPAIFLPILLCAVWP